MKLDKPLHKTRDKILDIIDIIVKLVRRNCVIIHLDFDISAKRDLSFTERKKDQKETID